MKPTDKRLNEIINHTVKWRGLILHQMSYLEKALDNYIIFHLTDKKDEFKVSQMQLLIFGDNRISLESKRQVFHEIARNHDIKWYKSYNTIRKIEVKKDSIAMNRDLVYCIEQRNIFAHCVADTTDETLQSENQYGFLKFKDTSTRISITETEVRELELTIVALSKHIADRNRV